MYSLEASILAAMALFICSNLVISQEHYDSARSSLGHFPRLPHEIGKGLYEKYFETYVEKEMAEKEGKKKLNDDDWRKHSPTFNHCVSFLKKFIARDYKLEFMLDIIQMDSCLGYLYEDHEYKSTDPKTSDDKKTLETLINDEKLKKIYEGTKFETLDFGGEKFLNNFFMFGLEPLVDDGKTNSCDQTTLVKAASLYGRGHDMLGDPNEDTYVDLLSDVVRRFGQKCFKELAESYSMAINFVKPDTRVLPNLKNLLPSPAREQLVKNNWPKKLMKVLQISTGNIHGHDNAIDFDKLQLFAYRLKEDDGVAKSSLSFYLEWYAKSKLKDPSSVMPVEASAAYNELKNDLCQDYISKDMVAWISLLSYPKFFGNMEWILFENDDPFYRENIRTMYLATFMCRYIDQTFATKTNDRYVVSFKHGSEYMSLWPMRPPPQGNEGSS